MGHTGAPRQNFLGGQYPFLHLLSPFTFSPLPFLSPLEVGPTPLKYSYGFEGAVSSHREVWGTAPAESESGAF